MPAGGRRTPLDDGRGRSGGGTEVLRGYHARENWGDGSGGIRLGLGGLVSCRGRRSRANEERSTVDSRGGILTIDWFIVTCGERANQR